MFVNIALQEPFGLTVIEAAAHGVPTVATKNGGPVVRWGHRAAGWLSANHAAGVARLLRDQVTVGSVYGLFRPDSPSKSMLPHLPHLTPTRVQDIMATLHHGVVVDPTDPDAVAAALLGILTHPQTWDDMSTSGVKNIMVGGGGGAGAGAGEGWVGRKMLGVALHYSLQLQQVHHTRACFYKSSSSLPRCPPPQAYSWPSHCKKYLDSIEAEKRSIKVTRVSRLPPAGWLTGGVAGQLGGLLGSRRCW